MLFNSFEFAVFLPIMFFACWYACGSSWRMQNVVLLAGSLVFYGWWDPRFLGLMLFSAVLDFTVSNLIHSTQHPVGRKALLGCSLVIILRTNSRRCTTCTLRTMRDADTRH